MPGRLGRYRCRPPVCPAVKRPSAVTVPPVADQVTAGTVNGSPYWSSRTGKRRLLADLQHHLFRRTISFASRGGSSSFCASSALRMNMSSEISTSASIRLCLSFQFQAAVGILAGVARARLGSRRRKSSA